MPNRSKKRSRYKAQKKKRYINALKNQAYNIFTFGMYLGILAFSYVLFYCLIFEPLVISKSYGSSDTREFISLAVAGFIIGISYIFRNLLNCTEKQQWQKNWRLLYDVRFDLERYASLKRMGIDHLSKRKKKHRRSSSDLKEKSN